MSDPVLDTIQEAVEQEHDRGQVVARRLKNIVVRWFKLIETEEAVIASVMANPDMLNDTEKILKTGAAFHRQYGALMDEYTETVQMNQRWQERMLNLHILESKRRQRIEDRDPKHRPRRAMLRYRGSRYQP